MHLKNCNLGSQLVILRKLKTIQSTLVEHEKTFSEMRTRLDKIEPDQTSPETMRPQLVGLQSDADSNANQIKLMTARINDADNRSRRNNLVFYGHEDTQNESWQESEKIVIEHCNRLFETTVQPRDIELAHRIGTFRAGKCRPIIVKFTHFKENDRLLSLSSSLKALASAFPRIYSLVLALPINAVLNLAKPKTQGISYAMKR